VAEAGSGFPELSPLGKRIELLRISRGLTKQQLAREAGTSRQQLWRVMTGKSELTSSLGFRLSQVLRVDGHLLSLPTDSRSTGLGFGFGEALDAPLPSASPATLGAFVADADAVERTLASLPADDLGRRLKRALLNTIEDLAGAEGLRLPPSFFALRGRVLNGEL
jgi:transcriptional regulator with XRE-family HTH domain